MAQPPARNVYAQVLRNFINSFKIGKANLKGNLIGKDHLGNEYFEIPANPSIGKRSANRYFKPAEKEDFEQELPAEWESWLRNRRANPPTAEEIQANMAIIEMKQKNAALLEEKYQTDKTGILTKQVTGLESFPQYPDYEFNPGKDKK